jgi:N-acetylneuraminic acid mutarotase
VVRNCGEDPVVESAQGVSIMTTQTRFRFSTLALAAAFMLVGSASSAQQAARGRWDILEPAAPHIARFESGYIKVGERFYLIGARQRPQPVEIFDPATKTWKTGAVSPVIMHHFQPVVYDGKIYVLGALTGSGRGEPPLPDVYIYDPAADRWEKGPAVPTDRLRGGAGVTVYNDLIYLVAGHQLGHSSGHVPWLDSFNPKTGEWRKLADAPRPRDHFQAVVLDGKMYAVAGRRSAAATGNALNLTTPEIDIYEFSSGTWSTLPATANIPTQRAGVSTVLLNGQIIVIGGESPIAERMHTDVESFNPKTMQWTTLAPLNHGRHGTGAIVHEGKIYIAAGSSRQAAGDKVQEMFTP